MADQRRMAKPKTPVRTKDQIIADELRAKEISRKRVIVVDYLYPALKEATVSVEEAKALTAAISQLIMAESMKLMREKRFVDISESMLAVLCQDGQRKEEITKLLSVFNGENLFTTRELVEGMTSAIDKMIREDMQGRKLETLNADWARFLN